MSVAGKTCIITGANSGIGLETARELARAGAHVVMVCRNRTKAANAKADIEKTATGPVDLLIADLASLTQVRTLAKTIEQTYPRVDVFISNAGVWRVGHSTTEDGYETTFAVNHLAPFLLINLLLDRLKASGSARIVVVSSIAHAATTMPDDPLAGRPRGWLAYRRSKLANVLFAYALARRLRDTDVSVNCLHPGLVRSRLGSGNKLPVVRAMWLAMTPWTISAADGARTSIHLAASDDVEGISGQYFDRSSPVASSKHSYDEDAQEKLWDLSARLSKL